MFFQWRRELEEIIEVASLDSELWVSMLSEAMKTYPSTGSLNTDIADLDEHRPIFGELVNDLRKLLKKQNDPAMLPLECHYLNKTALASVVGALPSPVKHFTLKRKPKSTALRAELLQKSTDAASNLKKNITPTVPVRSRGMPRKLTDTSKKTKKQKKINIKICNLLFELNNFILFFSATSRFAKSPPHKIAITKLVRDGQSNAVK